jgi:hypothetical protein
MRVRLEQTVMSGERRLDLRVLRQHRDVSRIQALGSLALGEAVVVDALFRHDPRGFLGQRPSQLLRSRVASFRHLATL